MLNKGFLKSKISVEVLGKRPFWTGIITGVLFSFVLSYLFNYSRELFRTFTFLSDFIILTQKDFRRYDLFFATFSTSLGFGFTIIYWLSGRNINIKKRYLITYAVTNAWLIVFIAIMVVARFGSLLPIFIYTRGHDNQFNVLRDFWFLLLLIPVYTFFSQWNAIRLIFRTGHWILLSIVFYIITSFFLFKTTSTDRNILNQKYYSINKDRFDYIDDEFKNARKYDVLFRDTTKEILRKKYAERTTKLVYNIKQAFNTNRIISLDTLILKKIIIHNMNRHELHYYGYPDDRDKNWPYALPENIYCQILKHDINSKETKVLFDILVEQISLFTAPEINWKEKEKFTDYEIKKSLFRRNLMHTTTTIQSRLIQVVEKLKSDQRYEKFHYLLPDIKFDDFKGSQQYDKIKINGC